MLARGFPVPGQKLGEAIVGRGTGDDALQDVGKPDLGIEPIELRRLCRLPNYAEWPEQEAVTCLALRPVEQTLPPLHSA